MIDLEKQKKKLADYYLRRGYGNQRVVDAFLKVPREEFILPELRDQAYIDQPLPLRDGQTISAPHMCVLTLNYAQFKPGDKVLDIGTGSGYQAALIAEVVGEEGRVYGIEWHERLAEYGMRNLERTGYSDRVTVIAGDGTMGWPEPEVPPFDVIVIAAAGPTIPPPLVEQLRVGGKLFMPQGERFMYQDFIEVTKQEDGSYTRRVLTSVAFVPLVGQHGVGE